MPFAFLSAQPRTLYKPKDIENARKNIEKHQWARSIAADRWAGKTEFARQQERRFFEDFIPELTPHTSYFPHCPACLRNPETREVYGNNLTWDISSPDRLTCKQCGTVYPNEKYPETGVLEAFRMGQRFTYYQPPGERALPAGATPGERSKHALIFNGKTVTISFSGLIRFHKVRWAIDQALRMAKNYAVTGDTASAERAAWILERFAHVYPKYLWRNMDGSYVDLPPSEVAAQIAHPDHGPRGGGKFSPCVIIHPYGPYVGIRKDNKGEYIPLWQGFFGSGRIDRVDTNPLISMTITYDLIKDAVYPDGRKIVDGDMSKLILNNIIDAGCKDLEYWNDICNKSVGTYVMSAAAGILLEQPERIRRAIVGLNRIMEDRYHFDGFYTETPAYSMHNYGNMWELPELLNGYSDPPGYMDAEGKRIDNLNIFGSGRLHLAMLAMVKMLAPDRRLPNIGDTYYNSRLSPLFLEVLVTHYGSGYIGLLETLMGAGEGEEYSVWFRPHDIQAGKETKLPLRSEWFPGWHVGVLRGGRPDDTALYLNGNEAAWSKNAPHRHFDMLNLAYYAYGKELVSDRGYFSGNPGVKAPDGKILQHWARSSFSHNLVVVDESDQRGHQRSALYGTIANGWPPEWFTHPRAGTGSNLELFGTAPGIEVIQASDMGAYPQCEEYRRTVALINRPGGETYAVDFFRVKGGKTHQYVFHCQGSLKEMQTGNGEKQPVKLSQAWSRWISAARGFKPAYPSVFTWNYEDVKLGMTVLNSADTAQRIIIADAPGARRERLDEYSKPPIQQVIVENRADGQGKTVATQYASVIIPYKGDKSPVISARLLANDKETGVMAVEVRFEGRTDYIISAKDCVKRSYGPVALAGHFGFVSVDDNGEALQSYLIKGISIEAGKTLVSLPEATTKVPVSSVSGRTVYFSNTLGPGLLKTAGYIISEGPPPIREGIPRLKTGFEIEALTGNSLTVRDYPVVECRDIRILHSGWTNKNRWW